MKAGNLVDPIAMLRTEHAQLPSARETLEGNCDSCGLPLRVFGGYQIPGLRGKYCSVLCVEAELFGFERCNSCGREMEGKLKSRQYCDDHCQKNAEGIQFGNGDRLKNWLKKNAPAFYGAKFGKTAQDAQISIGSRPDDLPQPEAGKPLRKPAGRKGGAS